MALLITFNKAFNDMVHVARSFSNLKQLSEDKSVAVPRNSFLASIRSLFRFFPIHRIFHSIELTILILIANILVIESNVLIENPLQLKLPHHLTCDYLNPLALNDM